MISECYDNFVQFQYAHPVRGWFMFTHKKVCTIYQLLFSDVTSVSLYLLWIHSLLTFMYICSVANTIPELFFDRQVHVSTFVLLLFDISHLFRFVKHDVILIEFRHSTWIDTNSGRKRGKGAELNRAKYLRHKSTELDILYPFFEKLKPLLHIICWLAI